jgi:hypothetical protein
VSLATGQKFTVNVFNGTNTGGLLNNSITLDTTATGTPNGAFSEYAQIDWEGTYAVELLPPGSSNVSAAYGAATVSPAQGSHYTGYVYLAPGASSTTTLACAVYNDDPQTVSSGQYTIRMLNTMATGVNSATGFDLYLTTAGTLSASSPAGSNSDLTSSVTPILSSPAGMTAYTTAASSGSFRLRLTEKGTQKVVFDTDNVTLSSGAAYTLVTYSLGSAVLPTVMLVTPSGDPVVLTNSLTRIRFVQGSTDVTGIGSAPTATVLINGAAKALTTFGAATQYFIVPTTPQPQISVVASNSPTSPYVSITSQNFVGGQDYAVYTTLPSTTKSAPNSLVLLDNNLPPANGGEAGVVFVNATASGDALAGSVDVTVDSSYLSSFPSMSSATPITSGATTPSLLATAADHKILFLNYNSKTVLVSSFDIGTLVAGGLYSVALIGSSSTTQDFMAVVTQTNTFS